MPGTCFVPGCNTGYVSEIKRNKEQGKRNPSLFQAPRDTELLDKWRRAIPRKDLILQSKHKVCELHFDDESVIRNYTTNVNGQTHVMERGKLKLVAGAIPTKFPNCPAYLSKATKKRKAPAERSKATAVKKIAMCDLAPEPDEISFDLLDISGTKLPPSWMYNNTGHAHLFLKYNSSNQCERHVVIAADLTVKVFIDNKEIVLATCSTITNEESISNLLLDVDSLIICKGLRSWYLSCNGFVSTDRNGFCYACQTNKEAEVKEKKAFTKLSKMQAKNNLKKKNIQKKNIRLKKKVSLLKNSITEARISCLRIKKDVLHSAISTLPEQQQEAIKTCVDAAKLKNRKSMRYSAAWIYECLLLRIKSKKAYNHILQHKILALPSLSTLTRYIRKIKGSYGFQQSTFSCLKKKSSVMHTSERRGAILIDEMKLTKSLHFNRQSMKIQGFIDLGHFTPADKKTELGDHALVFMYQPFRGKWVQTLGCFLSKGAAPGKILHHLVMEAIILLEKSGFFVDAVVSDGASWNRSMWSHFGISAENVSCPHIFDLNRRLWFISDFPHLIKNLRNSISTNRQLMTHLGEINTQFWEAVVQMDTPKGMNLKACPFLSMESIYPQNYQKMNVSMAFQFFSTSVAAAMESYKNDHCVLEKSGPCIEIIKLINSGIRAMNSRTPFEALKLNSPEEHAIKVFLEFITKWEKFTYEKQFKFISESTCTGLKVTLQATLQLAEFLTKECNFSYLMTSRLNQDSLERFFSMMRHACGSNDHPDPQTFLQLYRLLSTYSLIKPPKGSSVAGSDMLSALISMNDVMPNAETKSSEFSDLLDKIIDQGVAQDVVPEALEMFDDHNYDLITSSNFIIGYVAGYVARRVIRFASCDACKSCLIADMIEDNQNEDIYQFIKLKNRGGLIYPNENLVNLIVSLEQIILKCIREKYIDEDLLIKIMEELSISQNVQLIGCSDHNSSLTERILQFYLVHRMHFICTQINKNDNNNNKTKKFRKYSKL